MNKDEYEKLMHQEWRTHILEMYMKYCERPQFDQIKDLADCNKLYDFFYPLGIGTNRIHDVSFVCKEVDYAHYDDGDLSIIVANISTCFDIGKELEKLLGDKDRSIYRKNIFVMRGWHAELNNEVVAYHALIHMNKEESKFNGFIAKSFSHEMLSKLHSFVPRFKQEIINSKLADTVPFDAGGENDLLETYMKHRDETTKLLVEAIENE